MSAPVHADGFYVFDHAGDTLADVWVRQIRISCPADQAGGETTLQRGSTPVTFFTMNMQPGDFLILPFSHDRMGTQMTDLTLTALGTGVLVVVEGD